MQPFNVLGYCKLFLVVNLRARSCWRFQLERQGVDGPAQLFRKDGMHQAVTVDPGLAGERSRDHFDAEMGLASGPGAGVTGMVV